jgi:nicotinate-nucleotide pyrophosphorylase (carboxylating)
MDATAGSTERNPLLCHLLHPVRIRQLAEEWLKEDTPSFDYGGFVVGDKIETAVLLCKSRGVLAGCPFFDSVFSLLDCSVQWTAHEGNVLEPICQVARVTGKVRNLLLGERVALNCLARSSGIATNARRLKELARSHSWHGEVAGTRKTTPGFRLVEKYALLVGGISMHRCDLSSMVMLKDNHIWSAGSITQCVRDARQVCGFCMKIEVECRSVSEACEAAAAGADVIMLDNFHPKALHEAALSIKDKFPAVLVEASGGITEQNVTEFMGPHVDVISLGSVTHNYTIVNFSLKICAAGYDPANPTVTCAM